MSEITGDKCPDCGHDLLFSDDPNQEGWGSSGEFSCPNCGYWATDNQYTMDVLYEGDDDDDYEDEDY